MASPAPATPIEGRVPAETIRRCRLHFGLSRDSLAQCFKVSLRTVQRWEASGVDPEAFLPDPGAHPSAGPDWRRKLLKWFLDCYLATLVADNRQPPESRR